MLPYHTQFYFETSLSQSNVRHHVHVECSFPVSLTLTPVSPLAFSRCILGSSNRHSFTSVYELTYMT